MTGDGGLRPVTGLEGDRDSYIEPAAGEVVGYSKLPRDALLVGDGPDPEV